MSSRALRKLQREQEQRQQQMHHEDRSSDSDDENDDQTLRNTKQNMFDMLNEGEASQTDGESDNPPEEAKPDETIKVENVKPQTRAKKKKKNGRQQGSRAAIQNSNGSLKRSDHASDEIDRALKTLSMNTSSSKAGHQNNSTDDSMQSLHSLLAVDPKNLNSMNEMRRLFGNAVLEAENQGAAPAGAGRRRGRGPQMLDLGGALAGRNAPGGRGQGLTGLALRRNVFMQGKEEWPRGTGGGLGMEVVEKHDDRTIEYRFVRNTAYQDVQRQFQSCVESMDPQRMIQLLLLNPYHISTLLQVSEIAKQQGDHSVSGDLLERALFSFGRSVHSSFATSITEGRACFDFRRPENREFWLAAWRYTTNLSMRGTWRTAYEWAKLLLSLDPEGDPYRIGLVIDQFAIRAHQADHFLALAEHPILKETWRGAPNIKISKALAEYRLGHGKDCRASLGDAVQTFPWVFERLFHELNINHLPKSIWGSRATTEVDELWSELYVRRAKDFWNTPEATSLLVEVAESSPLRTKGSLGVITRDITLDEARHVLLSDTPELISLIPRKYTTMQTSSADPLPPPDNLPSYTTSTSDDGSLDTSSPRNYIPQHETRDLPPDEASELQGLQAFFSRIVSWLRARSPSDGENEQTVEDIDRAVAEAGVSPEVIEERHVRMIELQGRLRSGRDGDRAEDIARILSLERVLDEQESRDRPDEDEAAAPQEEEEYDDERNQRWLAGRGLVQLRDFVAANGVDEGNWAEDVDAGPVTEYARRVLQLQRRATRNFILDYVLQQGISGLARELVDRYIENASRGMEG